MGNDFFTHDDLELFELIRNEIINHPDRFLEAGEWLNQYYNEEKFWEDKTKLLNEYNESYKCFDNTNAIGDEISKRIEWLSQICKSRNYISWEEFQEEITDLPIGGVPVIYRLLEAKDALCQKLSYNYSIISKHDATCIYLLTWLLTYPEPKNGIGISITEFQKHNIDELDGQVYSRMSLVFPSRNDAAKWIDIVKIAKQKLDAENKDGAKEGQKRGIYVENLNARNVLLGDNAQHAERDINTIMPEPKNKKVIWGLLTKIGLIVGIIASVVAILSHFETKSLIPPIPKPDPNITHGPTTGRFLSPSDGNSVSEPFKFKIELRNPDNTKFYYIVNHIGDDYWPKDLIPKDSGTIYEGTCDQIGNPPGGRFSIVLYEVDTAMHKEISRWKGGSNFPAIQIKGRDLNEVDLVLRR